MISKKDRIYIAGFFDGEGCVSGKIKSANRYPGINIQITQKFPTILYWIQRKTNLGRIVQSSTNSSHRYIVTSKENVLKFIKLILPYSIIKRQQLLLGLELAKLIGPFGGKGRVSKVNLNKRIKLHKELRRLKKCDLQLQ